MTVCAKIIWFCKPIVAAAVRVAGLGGEHSGCGDPGPVGYTAKLSETPLDTAYGQYFDI